MLMLGKCRVTVKIEPRQRSLYPPAKQVLLHNSKFSALSITNDIASSKTYDKQVISNFKIVNFPLLTRSHSYGVYIFRSLFARVCSNVSDFNNKNQWLTAKLLKQGYRYHIIRKTFSKFYHRHSELNVKYNVDLKTLLQKGILGPIFVVI